ncbi:hypothetical protein [Hydrogenimonas sp.]
MVPKLLFLLTAALAFAEEAPRFMPENSGAAAHPVVTTIKLAGMAATAIFVVVMVAKSIKRIKNDEDDSVHLPD